MLLLSLPTLHHVNDDDVHGASGRKALVLAQLDACGGGETVCVLFRTLSR
jgi:hypothetical protein